MKRRRFFGIKGVLIAYILIFSFCKLKTMPVSARLTPLDIANLQQEIFNNGYGFTVGPNAATRRSIKVLAGLKPPEDWREMGYFQPIFPDLELLPSSFNWCDQGVCPEVRDQGPCGSCWAFATVGALECAIKRAGGPETDLSEQYLVSCNRDGWSCGGGWWAHDYHMDIFFPPEEEGGAVPEEEFPYQAQDAPCGGPYSHPYKIMSWAYIGGNGDVPSVDTIKQAIYDYGPVSVAVAVDSAFQAYTGGIFDGQYNHVNHGVVLTGWQDDPGVSSGGYWYLRNSWGSGWGENGGYMRIAYGANRVGYAASYIYYASPEPDFQLLTPTQDVYSCIPGLISAQIIVESVSDFSDPVILDLLSCPDGVSFIFDTNPVFPPGDSQAALTVIPEAAPGTYILDVQGSSGYKEQVLSLNLSLEDTLPGPPALLLPADGEARTGYDNIYFEWEPQTSSLLKYHLQVDDNQDFSSPEADLFPIPSESYILPGPLDEGKVYYWRVSSIGACGEGPFSEIFSFETNAKPVLLVDDDDNSPDVRQYYEDALNTLGYAFDVWDTQNSDNEPAIADLYQYNLIVWFTGDEYGGYAGPGPEGEEALANYLESGGKVFMSSQDYHYDRGLTPFMEEYLGISDIYDDLGGYSSVSGQNAFSGLGPFPLVYPYYDYSDKIEPDDSSSLVSFIGNNGNNAGVYTEDTVFFAFPWEAIANNMSNNMSYEDLRSSDGYQLLQEIIEYLLPDPNKIIVFENEVIQSGTYQASKIIAEANVAIADGAEVTFIATDSISIRNNFVIGKNAKVDFKAKTITAENGILIKSCARVMLEATDFLILGPHFSIETAAEVILKAGNYIRIMTDFTAALGCRLDACILDECQAMPDTSCISCTTGPSGSPETPSLISLWLANPGSIPLLTDSLGEFNMQYVGHSAPGIVSPYAGLSPWGLNPFYPAFMGFGGGLLRYAPYEFMSLFGEYGLVSSGYTSTSPLLMAYPLGHFDGQYSGQYDGQYDRHYDTQYGGQYGGQDSGQYSMQFGGYSAPRIFSPYEGFSPWGFSPSYLAFTGFGGEFFGYTTYEFMSLFGGYGLGASGYLSF